MKRTNTTIRLNTLLIKSLSNVLLLSPVRMINDTGIANSTWYYIMEKPEGISIQQLLSFANGLHIPVRRFFSLGKTDVIGKREDYITEPYNECRYDDAALQQLINASTSATWQKAAKAIGMSRSRLRDSLLAVTRTPVERFLKVCEAFDINPFTILIDPNPEPTKQSSAPRGSAARKELSLLAEVAALTDKLANLNATVADITAKYDNLLRRHNELLNRHNDLERRYNDFVGHGSTIMAADGQ